MGTVISNALTQIPYGITPFGKEVTTNGEYRRAPLVADFLDPLDAQRSTGIAHRVGHHVAAGVLLVVERARHPQHAGQVEDAVHTRVVVAPGHGGHKPPEPS